MKIILLSTFLCSGFLFAQDKPNTPANPETKTKIELFQNRKGGVVIKSFEKLFELPFYQDEEKQLYHKGTAELWELIDGGSGEKVYGIKISMPIMGGQFGRTKIGEDNVFLDADEVDAVIKGIEYILAYEAGKTKYKHWQVDFKSKEGFEVRAFSTKEGTKYAVDTGRESRVYPRSEIESLKEAFVKAKGMLGSK